jgi:long-chain acyl-CoA synthetase
VSLPDQLRTVFARQPAAPAIFADGRWRSWEFLSSMVTAVADLLDDRGVPTGTAVGLMPRNNVAMAAAALAVIGNDRCLVSINPLSADTSLAADIATLRVPVILASAQDWERAPVLAAALRAGSTPVLVGDEVGQVTLEPPPDGLTPEAQAAPIARPGIAIDAMTSGTTGPPRRVSNSYKGLERSIAAAARHYYRAGPPTCLPQSPHVLCAPIANMSGMWTLIQCAAEGRRIVLLEKFEPLAWAQAVSVHRPKLVSLPPAAIRMVLDAGVPATQLASLHAVRCGTAALPPDIQLRFESTYSVPVLPVYGATEFGGAAAGWTIADHRKYSATKLGSAGRALPGVDLRVVDPNGAEQAPGKQGLLEVRMAGGDGWLRTTDLAVLDEDGFLWLRGRADDAIIRGGFKVDPRKVERTLETHPSVYEAAVVGLPDQRLGALPAAAVVLKPGAYATPSELIDWARLRGTPYEVPARVLVVDKLPRTLSQKVARAQVVDLIEGAEPSPAEPLNTEEDPLGRHH